MRPWQLAALRMRPVLRSSASAVSLDETLLGQVRYRCKGWNDGDTEQDALRALSELGRLVGDVPVVLVGHAMGGRAALRVAAHPQVRGVVALAPWLPAGEPVAQLVGRSVLLVHGHDGRASGVQVWGYAERARAAGARAGVVVVRGGGPWMLRRAGAWHRTVASAVRQVSRPPAPGPQGVWSSSGPVFV
ncbi:alpha/beta hydrolase [Streptomyces sp. NBC_00696]|uniref:alpha/beta hydrolase n=1 Tax=Streptomyces sp. NBC_00696 TaxID=2903672 RepID=UPI002E3119E1|nr:alpha/beta hydrolase [Streptomyces sp. NBC_00696]